MTPYSLARGPISAQAAHLDSTVTAIGAQIARLDSTAAAVGTQIARNLRKAAQND